MKTKKVIGWALLGASLFLVVGGFVIDCSTAPQISYESYKAIQLGMTKAEVLALLGPPGTYFASQPTVYYTPERGWIGPYEEVGGLHIPDDMLEWNGDKGGINIHFNRGGQVVGKRFFWTNGSLWWWRWILVEWRIR